MDGSDVVDLEKDECDFNSNGGNRPNFGNSELQSHIEDIASPPQVPIAPETVDLELIDSDSNPNVS